MCFFCIRRFHNNLSNVNGIHTGTSIGNATYAGLFNGTNLGALIIQTRNGDGKKQYMLRGDNNVDTDRIK